MNVIGLAFVVLGYLVLGVVATAVVRVYGGERWSDSATDLTPLMVFFWPLFLLIIAIEAAVDALVVKKP